MSKCYSCDAELTEENRSSEHIILNACGGRLCSEELLCKVCNNNFGSSYDAEIGRQTTQLSNILHIKRDRNRPPDIKGKVTSTGEDINIPFEGALTKVKPIIEDRKEGDKVILTIEARDMEQFAQIARGLKKRKYPGLPLQKLLNDAQFNRHYLNDSVTLGEKIGGDDAFRSVTKTAINFFIHKGGDRKFIKHLIPYLNQQVSLDVARLHFLPLSIYTFDREEVSHIIKLVGNPKERILYCYIEYFNAQTYLVKLNDQYDGPHVDETYIYDVVNGKELKKTLILDYHKSALTLIFNYDGPHPFSLVQRRYGRVVSIAQARSDSRHIDKLSQEIVKEALKDLPERSPLTMEHIKRLAAIAGEKYAPFVVHKQTAIQKIQAKKDSGMSNFDTKENGI